MSIEHVDAYRYSIDRALDRNKVGRAQYMLGNLALHELSTQTARGIEPSDGALSGVDAQLQRAAEANESGDPFIHYRSRLLRAYAKPIVWARVMNYRSLTPGASRRVAAALELPAAYDEALDVTAQALEHYRSLIPASRLDKGHRENLKGFLNESSSVLVVNRPKSAKILALPSLAYEDQLEAVRHIHFDGTVLDNRKGRQDRQYPYQVKSLTGASSPAYQIPIVDMRDLGNLPKSSRWPRDDSSFTTIDKLIEEQEGFGSAETESALNRITSHVLNKIMRHP